MIILGFMHQLLQNINTMNMKLSKLLLCVCISVFSCTNNSPVSIVSLTEVSGKIKLNDIFDEFEYIPLETTDNSIFGSFNKLIVYDNKFFILDKSVIKKVIVFHDDGTYSHTIGNIGKGPGEYPSIDDFVIDEERQQVIILGFPSTVFIYDMKGQFIQKKQLSSSQLWNMISYKDGFVCSTNHQSFTSGDDARLIYVFDRDFNLKEKILNVLPVYVGIPPFITNPIFVAGNQIVYFDNFASKMDFIDIDNLTESKSIRLELEREAPPDVYGDAQLFFTTQVDYCFFLNAFFVNNVLWSSFANRGKQCVFIMDFTTNKKILSQIDSWYPPISFYQNGYFYSYMDPLWIMNEHDMFSAKTITKYPIEDESNPVIVRFKAKEVFESKIIR
ncbi:MAG: 6-bladed beta-propeller [Bacteroidales bacterium]|jgi:hypothetical protein|nr:6-bladed beta-propeller [Bacteroidales bacterium]